MGWINKRKVHHECRLPTPKKKDHGRRWMCMDCNTLYEVVGGPQTRMGVHYSWRQVTPPPKRKPPTGCGGISKARG